MKYATLILASGLAALSACAKSSSVAATTTSSVSGSLSVTSFPSKPSAVEAVNEKGLGVTSTIDTQGHFKLALEKAHTYRFNVILASGVEPMVFPRTSKQLNTTMQVTSGAAMVALGTIRHFSAVPASGFAFKSASTTPRTASPTGAAAGSDGGCVDGRVAGVGAACVDDDAEASCDNGADTSDRGADSECDNGKDSKTGGSCTDAPEKDDTGKGDLASADADPKKPMAIADHNAPASAGGCNEGDSEEAD